MIDLDEGATGAAAIPPKGTVVLLISGEIDRRWAAAAAVELGSAWARGGRRIVLADLHLEDPLLHAGLDVSNLEGVVDIFLYGASLSRIAQPVRGGEFYLIPAGTYAPDVGEIYRHPRWRKLVAGFRDSDAALVLFVPADGADLEALASWSSEVIMLGPPPDDEFVEAVHSAGLDIVAVLESAVAAPAALADPPLASAGTPDTVDSSAASSADRVLSPAAEPSKLPASPRSSSRPSRPIEPELELELPPPPVRRRPERRRTSVILWLLFLIVLLGTAAYLVATLRPDLVPGAPPGAAAEGEAVEASTAPAPNRLGELLPYSVQVRAFTSLDAARAEITADQRRLQNALFFISPEEIQGILYFRILSGLSTDTASATRLRDRLVEIGSVDEEDAAGAWSLLQFTPLAFDLGEFATREHAAAQADSLLALEIPSYPATVPYSDGTQRWQLYGGAYRDSASASSMREMLEAAGMPTRLTARTGLPATLPE
ncbi:MAG: hypothetical protein WD766_00720 [Gemmatimonadota bacterium]